MFTEVIPIPYQVIWVYVIFDWKRYSITIVSSFFIVYMVVSTVNDILVLRMIDLVTIRVFVKVIGIYRENPLVMIESNTIYIRVRNRVIRF